MIHGVLALEVSLWGKHISMISLFRVIHDISYLNLSQFGSEAGNKAEISPFTGVKNSGLEEQSELLKVSQPG